MNELAMIRQLYSPIQPSIGQIHDSISYAEFAPAPALQNFIYCYWQLKTKTELSEPFSYRVVADGCIDVFFEMEQTDESYVMGFCKKFVEFPLGCNFNYFGIRFLPGMFPLVFKVNARDLRDRFEHLSEIVPSLSRFIAAELQNCSESTIIGDLLNDFLQAVMNETTINYDGRFYDALEKILRSSGTLNVETDLDTGISQRQLRRLFEYYIGDTAKTFCQVVRFQHILRAKPSTQSLRQNKIFYNAGYYDQAHFIKEFKTFYGVTPSRAFGR